MTDSKQSAWRIELAGKLAARYSARPGVRMTVLGGSPSRGISDAWSDLDIVVYWDRLDIDWIRSGPLQRPGHPRIDLLEHDPGICMETYLFDGLKADFGHVDMKAWSMVVDQVLVDLETDGGLQKSLQGFLDSIVLFGAEEALPWKERIAAYPPALGEKMIRENLRFFVRGYLLHQCWERGDRLAYRDGICTMLKNILGVLAGLNGVYLSKDEPRWLRSELSRMALLPDRTFERMNGILSGEPAEAVEDLDGLIREVISMVEAHVPSVDAAYRLERYEREVLPCTALPELAVPEDPGPVQNGA